MPYSGEYYDQSFKIKLTREFVLGETRIDFKVIAVAIGSIPSEVAQWTYDIKPNINPIVLAEADSLIKRASKTKEDDVVNF